MAEENWKVKLFIHDPAKPKDPPVHADNFGIKANGHDRAKRGAVAWLKDHGYTVRAVNFSTSPREMIAYAIKKDGSK